jgi:hypothetical protein
MRQLELTKEELENIGFKKYLSVPNEGDKEREVYKIETLNGYFYYNPLEESYKWYHKTIIGEFSNHILLDITQKPVLFSILQAFQVDFNMCM